MDIKATAGENSEGMNKMLLETGGKGYPCYKMAENLAELYFTVVGKAEVVRDELEYLAKEISKY